jgi:hypothetical protein
MEYGHVQDGTAPRAGSGGAETPNADSKFLLGLTVVGSL